MLRWPWEERTRDLAQPGGLERSNKWPALARRITKLVNACACCGKSYGPKTAGLNVHHLYAFHDCVLAGRPDLELDERNLIVLCQNESGVPTEQCHITAGHLADFQSFNPTLKADLKKWKGKSMAEVKATAEWKEKSKKRPKTYSKMTPAQQTAFRKMLDKKLPPRTK